MDIKELKITSTVTIIGETSEDKDRQTKHPWKKTLQVGTKIDIQKDLVQGVGLGSLLQLIGFTIEEELAKVGELKPYLLKKEEEPAQ